MGYMCMAEAVANARGKMPSSGPVHAARHSHFADFTCCLARRGFHQMDSDERTSAIWCFWRSYESVQWSLEVLASM